MVPVSFLGMFEVYHTVAMVGFSDENTGKVPELVLLHRTSEEIVFARFLRAVSRAKPKTHRWLLAEPNIAFHNP